MERKMENVKIFRKIEGTLKKTDAECFKNFLEFGILEKIAEREEDYFFFKRGKFIIKDDSSKSETEKEKNYVYSHLFYPDSFEKIFSCFEKNKSFTKGGLIEHTYKTPNDCLDNQTSLTPFRERIEKMIKIKKNMEGKKIDLVIKIENLFFKINEEKFNQVSGGVTW